MDDGNHSHSDSDEEVATSSEPEYLNISQAIKLIPKPFSGNKNELREFISNVETALAVVNPNKHAIFLKFIESNITGDAKTKLLARSERTTWEQVKAILEENYTVRRTIDFFACKMFNSKQGASENVASWGSRIDTMSSDLMEAMIRILPRKHHEGAIAFLKFISKACFIQGLYEERIQTIVQARDERMLLPNAVEIALEQESALLSSRYKRQGNSQQSGFKKNFNGSKSDNRNQDFKGKNQGYVNIICYRCQQEGHISKECQGIPKCTKCNRLGHETKKCRSNQNQSQGQSQNQGNRS